MAETLVTRDVQTTWLPLSQIDLPSDARPHDPDKLAALTQDMKLNGQLQEIIVTPRGDRFEVVAGAGRTQAARKLGWEQIRCLVKEELSDFERLHITFSENEEREDISPLYQADLLKRMREAERLTQEELAERIGKSRGAIGQYMILAELALPVQEIVNRLTNLGLAHLLQICRLKTSSVQIKLAQDAAKEEWSVRELRTRVDKLLGSGEKKPAAKPAEPLPADPLADLWQDLQIQGAVSQPGFWGASYRPQSILSSPAKINAWHIWVADQGADPKAHLAKRLRWIADRVEGRGSTPQRSSKPAIGLPVPKVSNASATQTVTSGDYDPGLVALAKQGPGPLYAKLYGPDHQLTQIVKDQTWEQMGGTWEEGLKTLMKEKGWEE